MTQHKILLVDDDTSVLAGLRRSFHREPYEILEASNALEALVILGSEPIDVVISDVKMPVMSGTDFLARVRVEYPDIIRIILTGQGSLEVALRAINEGEVYRFFTKPCNAVDLGTTIRQALLQRDLLLENRRLLATLKKQRDEMESLGQAAKGLHEVVRDESGAIVLDGVLTDLESLVQQMEVDLEAAQAWRLARERLHPPRERAA